MFDDVSEKPAARRRRRLLLALSALVGVILPSLLAIAYYGFIASDQFVTEVRFLVKSGSPVTPDLLGQLTGTGSSISTFLDAQTVSDYLRSRQVVDDLAHTIDLREIFGRRWADPIARLPADASMEDLTEYWESMVDVSTEMMSGIVSVSVRTFTREDSARLGQAILNASEKLVNQLSARAREDAVRFATEDLQTAEERLRTWRGRVYQLREKEETLDATATAEAHTELVGQLEGELAQARSELQYRRSLMGDSAPLITSLRSKISSISSEIERVRKQATTGRRGADAAPGPADHPSADGRAALTSVLSGFEEAQAELAISEEYYKSALRYLEEARAQADRQQVYVATIVAPHEAEESRYPLRIQFIVFAIVVAGIVWGLVMLIAFSIRDHVM